ANRGDGTASIQGTILSPCEGFYPVTITADNGVGTATQQFMLIVTDTSPTPTFTTATSTVFVAGGAAQSFTVIAKASTVRPSITHTGSLPASMSFTDNGDGTATLAGNPGAGSAGLYPLTFTATSNGISMTQSFTLIVK